MVRISFHTTSTDKADKDEEQQVVINQIDVESISRQTKRYFPVRVCAMVISMLIVILGLVLGSIYTYRHYFPAEEPENVFRCHIMYEDLIHNRLELDMLMAISLTDNFQYINVVMRAGNGDSADIVHDFANSKTAYYDKNLDKCYVTSLNTNVVKPSGNLWELLAGTKREMYLPDNYILSEVKKVGPQVSDRNKLSPAIQHMCHGKEIFELSNLKFQTGNCNTIKHFEDRYMVETVICGGEY